MAVKNDARNPNRPSPLVGALLDRAENTPGQLAYEFLRDDGGIEKVSYGELYARAADVAGRLPRGEDPVLLLCREGLDFVSALWGCLLSGSPAVPAFPPSHRTADRLRGILADLRPAAVVTDPETGALLPDFGSPVVHPQPQGSVPPPLTVPATDSTAVIQYTSGSTSAPKGVLLSHGNLQHNVQSITSVFELDEQSRSVCWLPPYHDMGLIGGLLTPLHVGFPMRLMSPAHFLKSPLSWLRQISELGVTATGGPNFAYDLCVRWALRHPVPDIDLSTWKVAFNGAEPVRRESLLAFAECFAGNGFRPEAFLPCYGLAEATLIVSGRHWSPADEGPVVNCGRCTAVDEAAVVAPERGTRLPDGTEGEIWLRGPSVTSGYWNREDDSLFGLLDGTRFLRTGDLGLMHDGELFVTGRSKDVLIQHGVTHHAHDVETAVVLDDPEVRPTTAAFMTDTGEPEIVLVVERAPAKAADDERTAARLRARVLERTGVRIGKVVLGPPRTVPKTTSGKVQRQLTKQRFLAGELTDAVVLGGSTGGTPADEALETFLAGMFAGVCEIADCGVDQSLAEIGGDSVRATEIAALIEDAMSLTVPVETVLSAGTPRRLAAQLQYLWTKDGVDADEVARRLKKLQGDTIHD